MSLPATAQDSDGESQQRTEDRGATPRMPGARTEVYKTASGTDLKLYIDTPEGHEIDDERPAIVFFFGGGWRGGSPKQFEHQCRYLASRGMVAMAADYRVLSRQGTKAVKCVADARSAMRWIRAHADGLGVDADRVVASGGSAVSRNSSIVAAPCSVGVLSAAEGGDDSGNGPRREPTHFIALIAKTERTPSAERKAVRN